LKKKQVRREEDNEDDSSDSNTGKPARQFDIVETIESPYHECCKAGERFVALEILKGDHTVISMRSDGSWVALCYPEEYIVVSNVEEFNRDRKKSIIALSKTFLC